jgi:hypothetical protein
MKELSLRKMRRRKERVVRETILVQDYLGELNTCR